MKSIEARECLPSDLDVLPLLALFNNHETSWHVPLVKGVKRRG